MIKPQLIAAVEPLSGRTRAQLLSSTSTPGTDPVQVFLLERAQPAD